MTRKRRRMGHIVVCIGLKYTQFRLIDLLEKEEVGGWKH